MKPGLTGPMQVHGRGELTFEERLAVELDYVENLSIGRDLRILALTPVRRFAAPARSERGHGHRSRPHPPEPMLPGLLPIAGGSRRGFETIVADNGTGLGRAEPGRGATPGRLQVLRLESNLGYSRAVNRPFGARRATRSSC